MPEVHPHDVCNGPDDAVDPKPTEATKSDDASGWLSGLDAYELRARFAPGALAAVPAVAAGVAFGLRDNVVLTTIGGSLGFTVLAFVIASIARSLGKPHQTRIFEAHGGAPTTHALRLRSSEWSASQRQNWRTDATKATGKPLGAMDDDGEIEVVIEVLREATRSTETYKHLAAESVTFGFFRNLLGVRPLALGIAGLSLAASVGGVVASTAMDDPPWGVTEHTLAGLISLVVLTFFVWFPNDDRVWSAGRSYAERLMAAARTLAAAHPTQAHGPLATPSEPHPEGAGT